MAYSDSPTSDPRVSPDPSRTIDGVPTGITAFVGQTAKGPVNTPTGIASFGEYASIFGGLSMESPLSFSVHQFFANGGERSVIVRVTRDANDGETDQPIRDIDLAPSVGLASGKGIYALEQQDLFNVLVIPPLTGDIEVSPRTWAAAAAYCHRRRAFLIMDAPAIRKGSSIANAKQDFEAITRSLPPDQAGSANSAYYFPRVMATNPLTGALQVFAPSGAIAGVFARTDSAYGVWSAPAGMDADLQGLSGLSLDVNDRVAGELKRLGINCLREFPGRAPVIWGARTLHGGNAVSSEWKYVAVRRLALHIEESLDRGTRWVVFEPNDEPLWSQLREAVFDFMHGLFRRGALQGQTPERAFFVKCGTDTMTQEDIDSGVLNVLVGFASLRPAEFVILRIQQWVRPGCE